MGNTIRRKEMTGHERSPKTLTLQAIVTSPLKPQEPPFPPPVKAPSSCGLIYTRESNVSTGRPFCWNESNQKHLSTLWGKPALRTNQTRKFPPTEPDERPRRKDSESSFKSATRIFCVLMSNLHFTFFFSSSHSRLDTLKKNFLSTTFEETHNWESGKHVSVSHILFNLHR